MDVDGEIVDLRLKLLELEKQHKEVLWMLERYHKVLCVLGDDYRKRNDPSVKRIVEGMYG